MSRQFRHANTVPLATGAQGPIKVLSVDCGPGWVSLWSPNAFVRWRVEGTEDLVNESIYLETGPASQARVWVGRLGSSVYVDEVRYLLNGSLAANQATGELLSGLAPETRASATARFFPADVYRKGDGICEPAWMKSGQFAPLVGQTRSTLAFTIATATTVDLGFPIEERHVAAILCTAPLSAQVSIAGPGAVPIVLYNGPAAVRHTLNVSPGCFVSLSNATGSLQGYQLVWCDIGAVTNA